MTSTESTPAWTLIQAFDVLRRVDQKVSAEFVFHEEGGERLVYDGPTIAALRQTAADLIDETMQLENLVERLPNTEIDVTPADVTAGASRQLADGILDVRTALLAASVLPVAVGWPALSRALIQSDVHRAWSATTVSDLLGSFRGARGDTVDRVLQQAQVDAATLWVELAVPTVARLAEILETAADAGP